ncbi:MAG: DNA internalization-related competence protein ComEC/Rec2 [Bacilli bacterium]
MLKLRTILLHDYIYYILLSITVLITIINILIPRQSIYNENIKSIRAKIISSSITGDNLNLTIKNKEKLLITYYFKSKQEKINFQKNYHLGDIIEVKGDLSIPKKNTTKYLFNYNSYLKHKNIYYTVTSTNIKKLSNNKNIYFKLKNVIVNLSEKNAYLKTFLLGDKSNLSTKVMSSYQENGISHLFAISGMHIALLSSLITRFLKKFKVTEEKRYYITSTILIMYLLLVGFSPSILRGVLFYLLFSLNKVYYFYVKPVNIFIVILSISLLINYNYVFDIGFWYSFVISFSLIVTSKYLTSNKYLLGLLKTSIISFLVSIPISLYSFYQINISSIFYNLFFIPYVSIIVFPLSLITLVVPMLLPIYEILIKILEEVSLFLSHNRLLILTFPRINFVFYIIYYILIIIFIKGLLKKNYYKLIPLFVVLLIHYIYPYFQKDLIITAIDIGQGDSILLYSGRETVLIDTGGIVTHTKSSWAKSNKEYSIVKNTTIPLLKSSGIRKIDYLILSHGDADHMGEAINLVNNFKVEKVIFNCGEFNELEQELIKVLDKKKIPYYSCIKELDIDDNKLYFLNNKDYGNENDNSNVIYTELNGYKFMFMGDASVTTEKEILDKYNLPNIDVLKVGHHGSKTSSGKNFIDEISPKYSIISVGKNNRYGHPNKEVLENLDNSKIYRTDQDGSIMFKIKNNKLKIETCSP